MSFREDFWEAVRRVKRDFFRDSDNTNPTQQQDDQESKMTPSDVIAKRAQEQESQQTTGQTVPGEDYSAGLPRTPDAFVSSFEENTPPPKQEPPRRESSPSPGDDRFNGFQERDLGLSKAQTSSRAEEGSSRSGYRGYQQPSPSMRDERPDPYDDRRIYDFEPDDLYSDDRTVISRNTVIRGALQTDDSIRMLGQILGDIECKSNILVAGKVRGNTTAANAYVVDAQIDGNMMCDDSINVTNDAWILGNLRAQEAEIAGKIKGNIETRHAVSIDSTSSIIGNISTDELEIKRGAFVNGQIIMYSPSHDVMDRFDRFED